jgi:uncharacterized membrane protein HdeD (DUF308 family)
MFKDMQIRSRLLFILGSLSILLGIAFLYLRLTMQNALIQTVVSAMVIVLASATFLIMAFTEWFAAYKEGTRNLQKLLVYAFSGAAFALVAILIGAFPTVSFHLLIYFAAAHAIIFGAQAFAWAVKHRRHRMSYPVYFFAVISIILAFAMFGFASTLDELTAIVVLGIYLCFVGIKLIFFAWNLHHFLATHKHHAHIPPPDGNIPESAASHS